MATLTRTVEATVSLQAENRYVPVPFDVPAGTESIEVAIRFDAARAGIDLGCEGAAGWRGWSGGARTSYVIGRDAATPGYVPGELEPGEWNVVLGIHRVPAEGAVVEVEIRIPATSPVEEPTIAPPTTGVARGSSRGLPAPEGLTWYAGDFHAHTTHSDGRQSLSQLAALAARTGLDFLAVTDHNTVSHHALLPREGARHGITLIPGQEVTTHRGHANAFGDIGWIDFRRPATEWIAEAERRGGLLSINHPMGGDCSWLHPLEAPPHAVELWHATWYLDLLSTAPLGWYELWRERWADPATILLGGSDFHMLEEPQRPGVPVTWVAAAEPTVEGILDGVRAGRTAVSGTATVVDGGGVPDLFRSPVLLRIDGDLLAVDADGTILVDRLGRRRPVIGDRVTFAADPVDGPFTLVLADRRVVALSA